jgi:hypothetical protein
LWQTAGFGGRPRDETRSSSDVFADPKFVRPGGVEWDGYRLTADSPARGLGIDFDAREKQVQFTR